MSHHHHHQIINIKISSRPQVYRYVWIKMYVSRLSCRQNRFFCCTLFHHDLYMQWTFSSSWLAFSATTPVTGFLTKNIFQVHQFQLFSETQLLLFVHIICLLWYDRIASCNKTTASLHTCLSACYTLIKI